MTNENQFNAPARGFTIPEFHPEMGEALMREQIRPAELPANATIQRAGTRLNNAISDLDMSIGHLRTKIDPILGPQVDMEEGVDSIPPGSSPLAQSIDSEACRVLELLHIIQSLNRRIEL